MVQKPWLFFHAYWLASLGLFSLLFIQLRTTCPGMARPTVSCALLHQSLIKSIAYRFAYRQFYGSIFSDIIPFLPGIVVGQAFNSITQESRGKRISMAGLVYIVSSRSVKATLIRPCFGKKKKKSLPGYAWICDRLTKTTQHRLGDWVWGASRYRIFILINPSDHFALTTNIILEVRIST